MSQPVVRRGALKFKGEKPLKKARKSDYDTDTNERPKPVESIDNSPITKKGDGRVVCSGATLQGMETKFKEEIAIGDTIVVRHPQSLNIEERIVTAVLSQRTLLIHNSFSGDFVSLTEYFIRKDSDSLRSNLSSVKKEEASGGVSGTLGASELGADEVIQMELKKRLERDKKSFTYQQKTGMWGYKSVTQTVASDLTKEDLLDMRAKKIHDKYC